MTRQFKLHQTKVPKHIVRQQRRDRQKARELIKDSVKPFVRQNRKPFYKPRFYNRNGYNIPLSLLKSNKNVAFELGHFLTYKEKGLFVQGVGKIQIQT